MVVICSIVSGIRNLCRYGGRGSNGKRGIWCRCCCRCNSLLCRNRHFGTGIDFAAIELRPVFKNMYEYVIAANDKKHQHLFKWLASSCSCLEMEIWASRTVWVMGQHWAI